MSSTIFRRSSALLRPASSARLARPVVCYYHPPEVHSTKDEDFFIAASFPDDFEKPPSLVKHNQKESSGHWDELHATWSEVSVKADRGDINIQQQKTKKGHLDDTFQPESDLEPKIDEM
ncbi:hypothetical protein BO70DRAFT_366197 [Aspergillus heteromorphus CBS 117.55]|uniref:Uncharacterized protein n=1 Tax=Aspergillus heteromorphus CBS 117.55 TaxID=1448321 RepID=A0A317V6Y5_9EURO|nr:uncharacterized protein BO70DRAFT_366197 [Aspergillus heteromorphus CBS 117.55]PWY67900.1 hypothetical protein BO70DRAFT_366197 [Aspergillus heteromorphus CBS 117.55]